MEYSSHGLQLLAISIRSALFRNIHSANLSERLRSIEVPRKVCPAQALLRTDTKFNFDFAHVNAKTIRKLPFHSIVKNIIPGIVSLWAAELPDLRKRQSFIPA